MVLGLILNNYNFIGQKVYGNRFGKFFLASQKLFFQFQNADVLKRYAIQVTSPSVKLRVGVIKDVIDCLDKGSKSVQ